MLKLKQPERVASGSRVIDEFLDGGYERDIITTIYGPAGSGKTNLALLALIAQLREGKTVVYIDTEGSLSVARVQQLCPEFEEYADNLKLLRPTTFEEQRAAFGKLEEAVAKHDVGLIIVDSIAMLYRLEIGKSQDIYNINRELGTQLGMLTEIARKKSIPVLLTNQVYADFDNKDAVKMVGGDLLKYSSKCLIELKRAAGGMRIAEMMKHRSLPEGREAGFRIVHEGIAGVDVSDNDEEPGELI